jgi:ankyrin repeat protein
MSNAQSYRGVVSSLIHQLLTQRPDLARHAVSLKNEFGFIEPDVNSVAEVQKIFEDLLFQYANPNVNKRRYTCKAHIPTLYIVVDGLDELDRRDWKRFFDTFSWIINGNMGRLCRLLITSRNEPEIEERLAMALGYDLGGTNRNALDVEEYIRGTISDFGHRNNFGSDHVLEIVSEITRKAGGMFLWATLAWSLFIDGVGMWTKAIVKRKIQGLRQVPSGIERLYHRLLSLVDKRIASELLAALKWIVAASEPLTVDEIAVALSLRARPLYTREFDIPFNTRAFFRTTCPHLIKVDGSGAVTLVHLSFRRFLLETEFVGNGSDVVPNPFHFALKPVNHDVGLDCLSYMTMDEFSRESLEDARQHVFFSYCHKYWIHHLESFEGDFDIVSAYFLKLLNPETKKFRWYDTSKMIFQLWDRGLAKLFEPATRFGMDLNVYDDNGDHFIHHASNGPNGIAMDGESLRWLVDLGVDLNGRTHLGQTLLHKCLIVWHDALCHPDMDDRISTAVLSEIITNDAGTPKRPFEIALNSAKDTCKWLLSCPTIDLNATDKFWFSPLSYAMYWGMTDAMNMLLACPYLQAEMGHSALHIAAKEGLYDAVARLLERGADIHGRNSRGETVLHLAAAGGHYRILQLLVANAEPELLNAKDRLIDPRDPYANPRHWIGPNGWTPLHLAVTSGHDDLVLWLINHPLINLHIEDKHGRQPIAFAAAFGTKTMLKAFLSRDPSQFAHKDLFGNGLLHMASLGSNQENFDFLLSLEVTPDLGPNKWGNSIADLAPTLALEQHLHELGFVHSETHKDSCLVLLERHLEHTRVKLMESNSSEIRPKETDSSGWLMILPDCSLDSFWDYAFIAVEWLLGHISQTKDGYAFDASECILSRLPVEFNGRQMRLREFQEKHRGRPSAEDDRRNDLERLRSTFEGVFEVDALDRKEDWQRLSDILAKM